MADADPDRPQGGRFVGGTHRFAIRVYFEDTDLSGVVYHANYLRYMERARSDMLAVAGIDQRGAQDDGTGVYAVAHMDIRFASPARLGDALLVESRVIEAGAATCVIHQTVSRDRQEVAGATVTVAFLSPAGRPKRQPKPWVEAFRRLARADQTETDPS